MNSKTINSRRSTINSNTISREDRNKKVQMLTDKLAAHFKLRLASLIAEKNYKYPIMVLEIGLFLKKLGNNNFEAESVIPKLEKHLLEILAKMPSDHSKYFSEISKTNQILKTEVSTNNHNYTNPLINSANYVSNSRNILNRKINIKGNKNLVSDDASKNHLNDYYILKSLPNESSKKNIATKSGAHLAVNPLFVTKNDIAKNKILSETNRGKNILNIPIKAITNNNINKNEKINNLVTENNQEKNLNFTNYCNKNNLKTNNNYYPTVNTNEGLKNQDIYNSYSTNSILNTLNNNKAKEEGLNFIQKTEKLNDLKEKSMDEWAMIVKYNHLKHLEEEQKKKSLGEEKKRKVREILEKQMKEKDHTKKMKQEEDKKFFKMQTEKIENMEKDYVEKERSRLDKIKQQKEIQEKLIKGNLILKFLTYYFFNILFKNNFY